MSALSRRNFFLVLCKLCVCVGEGVCVCVYYNVYLCLYLFLHQFVYIIFIIIYAHPCLVLATIIMS